MPGAREVLSWLIGKALGGAGVQIMGKVALGFGSEISPMGLGLLVSYT